MKMIKWLKSKLWCDARELKEAGVCLGGEDAQVEIRPFVRPFVRKIGEVIDKNGFTTEYYYDRDVVSPFPIDYCRCDKSIYTLQGLPVKFYFHSGNVEIEIKSVKVDWNNDLSADERAYFSNKIVAFEKGREELKNLAEAEKLEERRLQQQKVFKQIEEWE